MSNKPDTGGDDGADVTPRSVPFDVVTVAQALGLS